MELPNPSVLEVFENQHPDRNYTIEIVCPEFTSVCPKDRPAGFWDTHHYLHSRHYVCRIEELETLFAHVSQRGDFLRRGDQSDSGRTGRGAGAAEDETGCRVYSAGWHFDDRYRQP